MAPLIVTLPVPETTFEATSGKLFSTARTALPAASAVEAFCDSAIREASLAILSKISLARPVFWAYSSKILCVPKVSA